MACERNFAGTTNQDLTLNNDHLVERVAVLTMTWSYVRKDSSDCLTIIYTIKSINNIKQYMSMIRIKVKLELYKLSLQNRHLVIRFQAK